MDSIFVLFSLGILCSLGLGYQVNEKEPVPPKLPLRPGDLLRSLDALTSDAQVIYSPLQETPLMKPAERRVYHDDESPNDNQESGSQYDYDKAYENFVNKYFAKGEEELESEDDNDDEDEVGEKAEGTDGAAPYELSDEVDEEQEQKAASGSKICERVEIDNQNCRVCEDPTTNEKSKTCSYSSSSDNKPKSYGYSKERSSKHSSDDDADDNDDAVDEDNDKNSKTGRSFKRETSLNNKKKFQPKRTSIEQFLKPLPLPDADDNTKCTRKREDGMICFYCGSALDDTRECIADKNNLKKRRLDQSSKKDSAVKKIFKRMVTYSFKNDAEPKIQENIYSAYKGY